MSKLNEVYEEHRKLQPQVSLKRLIAVSAVMVFGLYLLLSYTS